MPTDVTTDPVAHIPALSRQSIDGAADSVVIEVWRQDELARAGKFGGTHVMPGTCGPSSG